MGLENIKPVKTIVDVEIFKEGIKLFFNALVALSSFSQIEIKSKSLELMTLH